MKITRSDGVEGAAPGETSIAEMRTAAERAQERIAAVVRALYPPAAEGTDLTDVLDAEDVVDIGARQPVYAAGTSTLWGMAARDIDRLLAAHRALLARIARLEAERDEADVMISTLTRERDVAVRHQLSQRALVVEAYAERDAARARARGLREAVGAIRFRGAVSLDVPGAVFLRGYETAKQDAIAALSREPTPRVDVREVEGRALRQYYGLATGCHAGRDGECNWSECPQNREGEPGKSGRHCPLDVEDGR